MPIWAFLPPLPTPSPGIYDNIPHPRDPAHPSGEPSATGQDSQSSEQGDLLLSSSLLPVHVDARVLQDVVVMASFRLLPYSRQ